MTVSSDLLDDYAAWLTAAGASERTISARIQGARRLLRLAGADDVRQLQPIDVARFVASVPARQSRATYYQHAAALARFLAAMTPQAPGFMQGVPIPKASRGLPRPIPLAELEAALRVATLAEEAMLRLASYAGLRVAEISRVRGEDVGLTIFVRGKGGVDGSIPTHPCLATVAERMPATGWWFPNQHGKPLGREATWAWMKRPLRKVGSTATPHQLRHFYGTELLRGGANVRTVQQLLRHASLSSTEVYTQVVDADRRRAVEGLPLIA